MLASAVIMKLIGPNPEFYAAAGYAMLPLVLIVSYDFFLVVEKPGHLVARYASKVMDNAVNKFSRT